MTKRFDQKIVWITGGGSGIGRSLALAFADEGATVAVSGRRDDRLREVVDAIEAKGGKALAVACDVTNEESVRKAVDQILSNCGGLDVAVANAGFSVAGRIENLSAADWRRQFDVNVVGLGITVSAAMPHLRERKGRLALVGSVASMIPSAGVGAYAASKYAVRGIGQTLSVELHGTGVTCTTIHPGFVESEIAQVDNEGVFDASRKDNRPKNLMWTSDRAARVMVDAIARRNREYVFTGHGKIGAFVGKHMPTLTHFLMTRGSKKRGHQQKKSSSTN